jgi:non-homologous end joining protein Ku
VRGKHQWLISYYTHILSSSYYGLRKQCLLKGQEEEPEEKTTDILEALKASLKVKGKSSTVAKAKCKMDMATAASK